jgi:hypothetical protein
MIFLITRIFALTFFLLLAGCSSPISNPMMLMLHRVSPTGEGNEQARLDPAYHYLRLVVEDNVIFMASDSLNIDSANTVSVWYSAEREVLRFQNGRLVAAVGLTTEWRGVTLPELPAWSELALAKEPFSWTRTRDVMPGYRYGVQDSLLLRLIPAPNDSQLKDIDPHALTWFEERLDDSQNGVNTPADALPRARYAVDFRDANETVVYGEQCVSAKLCFSWQHWPVRAGKMK